MSTLASTEVRFGVLARGALEAGLVSGHGQPQQSPWSYRTRDWQHDRARRAARDRSYFVTV